MTGANRRRYKQARADLRAAQQQLQERGQALANARYQRAKRGTLIEEARRMSAQQIDVVTFAVLSERAAGATWAEVARALRLDERFVREHYARIEDQWANGEGVGPLVELVKDPPLRIVRDCG